VAGNENALEAEVLPYGGKIGERNPPVFRLLVDVRLEDEPKSTIRRLAQETLVILPVVIKGDFWSQAAGRAGGGGRNWARHLWELG
jgi:hypothetical protein